MLSTLKTSDLKSLYLSAGSCIYREASRKQSKRQGKKFRARNCTGAEEILAEKWGSGEQKQSQVHKSYPPLSKPYTQVSSGTGLLRTRESGCKQLPHLCATDCRHVPAMWLGCLAIATSSSLPCISLHFRETKVFHAKQHILTNTYWSSQFFQIAPDWVLTSNSYVAECCSVHPLQRQFPRKNCLSNPQFSEQAAGWPARLYQMTIRKD